MMYAEAVVYVLKIVFPWMSNTPEVISSSAVQLQQQFALKWNWTRNIIK